jgi:hypothetical protein
VLPCFVIEQVAKHAESLIILPLHRNLRSERDKSLCLGSGAGGKGEQRLTMGVKRPQFTQKTQPLVGKPGGIFAPLACSLFMFGNQFFVECTYTGGGAQQSGRQNSNIRPCRFTCPSDGSDDRYRQMFTCCATCRVSGRFLALFFVPFILKGLQQLEGFSGRVHA